MQTLTQTVRSFMLAAMLYFGLSACAETAPNSAPEATQHLAPWDAIAAEDWSNATAAQLLRLGIQGSDFTTLEVAVEAGNANAITLVGAATLFGREGKARDAVRAGALFEAGCEGGNMLGCNSLGSLYDEGQGVPQDFAMAATLYQRACDGDHAAGCTNVGALYEAGLGVSQDFARATALFQLACDAGHLGGCINLGNAYRLGRGVPQDIPRARELLTQGCDGGDQLSCDVLARTRPE